MRFDSPESEQFTRILVKANRSEMTPGRRATTRLKRPPAWVFPSAIEREYQSMIRRVLNDTVVNQATVTIEARLPAWLAEEALSRTDAWDDELQDLIDELRSNTVSTFDGSGGRELLLLLSTLGFDLSSFNRRQAAKQAKWASGSEIEFDEPWERDVIRAWARTNLALIRGLSEDHIKQINTIVSVGVQEGRTSQAIERQIAAQNAKTRRSRVRLIARDQVSKLNGQLTQRRQQELGISLYTWSTVEDERVRSSHAAINGKLCRWDNRRTYSPDGGKTWRARPAGWPRAHPGEEIQCRCTAIPYWREVFESVDMELAA